MADRNWDRWAGLVETENLPSTLNDRETRVGQFLLGIFGYSAFLSQAVGKWPKLTAEVIANDPDGSLNTILSELSDLVAERPINDGEIRKRLRQAKQQVALITALADLGGLWPVEKVCEALTQFADLAVRASLIAGYVAAFRGKDLEPESLDSCQGISILAMGKMGGFELNYSSDIDLFVVFDGDGLPEHPKHSPQSLAVAITRHMVSVLQDRSADGYVFRTDLRLRPDPGSTAIAVSLPAALSYYESYGQNWERSAMIKARFSAGDQHLAQSFLEALTPFVWRRSLDFYALQDIHSLKRQIYVHKGSATVQMAGHNVKLGRGGIREIELFAQIQQLIWGGKEVGLRTRKTLDALSHLQAMDLITAQERDQLDAAYVFLRRVEHVLQMRLDEQTHSLPDKPEHLLAVARIMGFEFLEDFERTLIGHMLNVEACYAGLFETSDSLAPEGNLVFSGAEDDPETLKTLEAMGFCDPSKIASLIRGWHTGRMRATRSVRAREILTELHPSILAAFAATAHPVDAMVRFDACLRDLPSGVQLFSLLSANPNLLDDVADIMGNAPELADNLTRWPSLFEHVISPSFSAENLSRADLDAELTIAKAGLNYEEWLDAVRRWFNEHKFRIGVQVLQTNLSPILATEQMSNVADVALCHAMNAALAEFREVHGEMPGSSMALLAYGKLGAQEMTPTSDLDLVFIYDAPKDASSDHPKRPLPATAYFGRLVQRVITACSSLTRNGRLFELDFRLRPSGDSGPLATSLDAFLTYQQEAAWTWEHMALLKARGVWGNKALRQKISDGYQSILQKPRDTASLASDVLDMRGKIALQHPDRGWWDAKYTHGGLVDLEFLMEFLQLKHSSSHRALVCCHPAAAPRALANTGVLSEQDAAALDEARAFWLSLLALRRLTQGQGSHFDDAPEGLRRRMAKALQLDNPSAIEKTATRHAKRVQKLTQDFIDPDFHSAS